MELKYKKTHKDAVAPIYATDGSNGMDLTAIGSKLINGNTQIKYNLGLAFEIPVDHVGLLFPRSSIVKTSLRLGNSVGVIDSDYRGEVSAVFDVTYMANGSMYKSGDRIVQMVIVPAPRFDLKEVSSLDETERGSGGYGSTGK